MNCGSGHPLAYPLCVTIGALAVLTAWAPFADPDQLSALAVVAIGIVGYSGYRIAVALGAFPHRALDRGEVAVRRVRQEYQLLSRSWLELRDGDRIRWLPVYFGPELISYTGGTALLTEHRITLRNKCSEPDAPSGLRAFPSGRTRDREPPGRLIDNPTRIDPEAPERARTATKLTRRLLLDAQSAVAAPFVGLLWVYVMGGGIPAFAGACCVTAAAGIWLAAIRGSDPS
ncbi:hypothetical protein [Nocardia carnea]|uniref:hypothetical protein n=1 Tax=Nocardia carnea TaxID=37328 RepID=UPI00245743B2|nr:hypothetical protein [Nocardia carnea]